MKSEGGLFDPVACQSSALRITAAKNHVHNSSGLPEARHEARRPQQPRSHAWSFGGRSLKTLVR